VPRSKLALASPLLLGIALAAAPGCTQISPVDYMDYEAYVRPDINPGVYKRAAILYVGFGNGSTLTQQENVGAKGTESKSSDEDHGVLTGYETSGADVVLFSNALMTALHERDVQLVERNRVRDVAREQGLAANRMLDLDDAETVQRIGRLLKVDLIIRGSVIFEDGGTAVYVKRGLFPKTYVYFSKAIGLSIRGIDTRTGQVVWMETAFVNRRFSPNEIARGERASTAAVVGQMVDKMVERFYANATAVAAPEPTPMAPVRAPAPAPAPAPEGDAPPAPPAAAEEDN